MTILEAERILDIVSAALQETSRHHHHPISALKGYDIFQIDAALKLRVANQFLLLANRADFEERFSEVVRVCGVTPWQIMMCFVPDDQIDNPVAEGAFGGIDPATGGFKDQRMASLECMTSFGDFCKSVGAFDPNYRQKVYARIGLEYPAPSQIGNGTVAGSGNRKLPMKILAGFARFLIVILISAEMLPFTVVCLFFMPVKVLNHVDEFMRGSVRFILTGERS